VIFRIVSEVEWDAAQRRGAFEGSEHDRRDGFIHFSTAEQLAETAAKHYAGRSGLLILFVDEDTVAESLKWEPSRGGALFPHLYATLPVSAVRRVEKLPLGSNGAFVVPDLGA
jgi:uncharacterized protein (DUF952 family)